MFSGNDRVSVPSSLPEDAFYAKVEDALSALGRVKVSKSGHITVDVKEGLKSFLTDVTADGTVRKKGDGYEVAVSYSLAPSVVNWVLAIVLFLLTCVGVVIIAVPALEKGKVAKAVTNALNDLEEVADAK